MCEPGCKRKGHLTSNRLLLSAARHTVPAHCSMTKDFSCCGTAPDASRISETNCLKTCSTPFSAMLTSKWLHPSGAQLSAQIQSHQNRSRIY